MPRAGKRTYSASDQRKYRGSHLARAMWRPAMSASNAIPRGGRQTIRLRENIMIGRLAMMWTHKLSDFWKTGGASTRGTTFTHFPDGTAHKNRMQGNDFVTSQMLTAHGVACSTCHDVHGTSYYAQLRKPANTLCLDCHGPGSPNGPHASTLEAHTHHKTGTAGSDCIACHMPKIAQTIVDWNVRSHTFRFVSPAVAETLHMPNACNICHTDKSAAWASAALKTWDEESPWRVAN